MAPVQSPPSPRKEDLPRAGSGADKADKDDKADKAVATRRHSPRAVEAHSSGDQEETPPIACRLRSSSLRTPVKGGDYTLRSSTVAVSVTPQKSVSVLEKISEETPKKSTNKKSEKAAKDENNTQIMPDKENKNRKGEEKKVEEEACEFSKSDVNEKKDVSEGEGKEDVDKEADGKSEVEVKIDEEEDGKVEVEVKIDEEEDGEAGVEVKIDKEEDGEAVVEVKIDEENEGNTVNKRDYSKIDLIDLSVEDNEEAEQETEKNKDVEEKDKKEEDRSVDKEKNEENQGVGAAKEREGGDSAEGPTTRSLRSSLRTPEQTAARHSRSLSGRRVLTAESRTSISPPTRSDGYRNVSFDLLAMSLLGMENQMMNVRRRMAGDDSSSGDDEYAQHRNVRAKKVHWAPVPKSNLPAGERPSTSSLEPRRRQSEGIVLMPGTVCASEESKATLVAKFLEPLFSKREGKEAFSMGRFGAPQARSEAPASENSAEMTDEGSGESAEAQEEGKEPPAVASEDMEPGSEEEERDLQHDPLIEPGCEQQKPVNESSASTSKDKSEKPVTSSEAGSDNDMNLPGAFAEVADLLKDDSGASDAQENSNWLGVNAAGTSGNKFSSLRSSMAMAESWGTHSASDSDEAVPKPRTRPMNELKLRSPNEGLSEVAAVGSDTLDTVAIFLENTSQTAPSPHGEETPQNASSYIKGESEASPTALRTAMTVCLSPLTKSASCRLKRKRGEPSSKTAVDEQSLVENPLTESTKKDGKTDSMDCALLVDQTPLKQKRKRGGEERLSQTNQISATSTPVVNKIMYSPNVSEMSKVNEIFRLLNRKENESDIESDEPAEVGRRNSSGLSSSAKRRRRRQRGRRSKGEAQKAKLEKVHSGPDKVVHASLKPVLAGPSTTALAEEPLNTPEDPMSAFRMHMRGRGKTQKKQGTEQAVQTSFTQTNVPLCCKCSCPVTDEVKDLSPVPGSSGIKASTVAADSAMQQEGVTSPWDVSSRKEKLQKRAKSSSSGKWVVSEFGADRAADRAAPLKRTLSLNEPGPSKQKKKKVGSDVESLAKHQRHQEETKRAPVEVLATSQEHDCRSDGSGKKPCVAVKPRPRVAARGPEGEAENEEAARVSARERLSRALTDLFLSAVGNSEEDTDDDWHAAAFPDVNGSPSISPFSSPAMSPARSSQADDEISIQSVDFGYQNSPQHNEVEQPNQEQVEEEQNEESYTEQEQEEEERNEESYTEQEQVEEEQNEEESNIEEISEAVLLGETLSSDDNDDHDWLSGLTISGIYSNSESSSLKLGSSRGGDLNSDADELISSGEENIEDISMRVVMGDLESQASEGSGDEWQQGSDNASDKESYISTLLGNSESTDESDDEWSIKKDPSDWDLRSSERKYNDTRDGGEEEEIVVDDGGEAEDEIVVDDGNFITIDLADDSDEPEEKNSPNVTIALDSTRDDELQEENEEETTEGMKRRKMSESEEDRIVDEGGKKNKNCDDERKKIKTKGRDNKVKKAAEREKMVEGRSKGKVKKVRNAMKEMERKEKGEHAMKKEREASKMRNFTVTDILVTSNKEADEEPKKKRKEKRKKGEENALSTAGEERVKKRKAENGEVDDCREATKKKKSEEDAGAELPQPPPAAGIKALRPPKSVIFKNLRTERKEQVRAFIEAMLPADKVQSFSVHAPREVSIAFVGGGHKRALKLNGVEYEGQKLSVCLEKRPPTTTTASLGNAQSYDKWGSRGAKTEGAVQATQTTQTAEAAQTNSQDKKYNVCIDGVPKTIPQASVQAQVQSLLSSCPGVGCINIYKRPQSSFYSVIVDVWGLDSYIKALQVQQPCVEAHRVAIVPIKLKGRAAASRQGPPQPPAATAPPAEPQQGGKQKKKKNKKKKILV